VEVLDGPPLHPESTPPWLVARFEYPARSELPPVTLTWCHGGPRPSRLPPELSEKWPHAVLFVGAKGELLADDEKHLLLPVQDFAGFDPPKPFIPDSPGHYQEWIRACKTGTPASCALDYSGALTQTVLLANVAYRVGQKIEWDERHLCAKGCSAADQFLQHHYRAGWKI
jgi:hypothetical protein